MVLPMLSIRLTERLIPSHPPNRVFHHNPPPRERPIIGDIFWWTLFAARFPARRRAQAFGVQFVNPNIRQIADAAHARRQPGEQSRLLQHRDIGGGAGHTVGPIHYLTGLLVDRDLAFERMLLFLAAVMRIGRITGIQKNHVDQQEAKKGEEFASVTPSEQMPGLAHVPASSPAA